jgi:hypothetical protein
MPKLRHLDCHECTHLADDALVKIATSIPSINFMDIAGCRRLTGTICSFGAAFHIPCLLSVWSVCVCLSVCLPVSLAGLVGFLVVETLLLLRYVRFVWLTDRTADKSIEAIQQHCPDLMTLVLGSTTKTSDPALREFRARRPEVSVYLFGAQQQQGE